MEKSFYLTDIFVASAIGFWCLISLTVFLFHAFEIVYMRNNKRPFVVYTNIFSRKLSIDKKQIISQNFTFYNRLKPKYQSYFDHRVSKFMSKYKIIGQEIEVTTEMKVLIASCYVKLTFGSRDYLTEVFGKIILYPDIYPSTYDDQVFHKGEFNPHKEVVKFSWKHFKEGINIESDNLNLGLHEFTHVLHFESKKILTLKAILFKESLQQLMLSLNNDDLKQKLIQSRYLRDYAFENQHEFVAVILEHFFETPQEFKTQFPEIYLKVKQMINYNEKRFIS